MFFGILVVINPRRCDVWRPIFSILRRRIGIWHNRHLSICGRVVLLNSILSRIPIFFFPFYKAPKFFIKEIILIQPSFLWGGEQYKKKISLLVGIKCVFQKDKGFGVNHSGKLNLVLLSKWKW